MYFRYLYIHSFIPNVLLLKRTINFLSLIIVYCVFLTPIPGPFIGSAFFIDSLYLLIGYFLPHNEREPVRKHLGSHARKRCWNVFPAHRIFFSIKRKKKKCFILFYSYVSFVKKTGLSFCFKAILV